MVHPANALRRKMLATVSAAAMALIIEGDAVRAQDAARPDMWLSMFGQYNWWDGGTPAGFWPIPPFVQGTPFDFTLGDGFGVGGELGFRIDELHTVVARLRYNEMERVGASSSYFDGEKYSDAEGSHREHAFIGDLEIGRDVGLGSIGLPDGVVRLHAGVRIAHFAARSDVFFFSNFNIYSGNWDIDRDFTGAGPRIGFDASVPLGTWVRLEVSGAGALLFGRHSFDLDGIAFGFGPAQALDFDRSDFVVVPGLDGSSSLKFMLSDTVSLSLGYRFDAFFNVHDDGGPSHHEDDRIIHGPFGLLTIALPGSAN